MFEARLNGAAGTVRISIDGKAVEVPQGITVAEAMLLADMPNTRLSTVSGSPRAPYCMMGICFECLVTVDGVTSRQGCMIEVRDAMKISRQLGKAVVRP